jgi:hypothetical protein
MLIKRFTALVSRKIKETEKPIVLSGKYWCEKCKREFNEETLYIEEENKYLCKKCCKRFGYSYLTEDDEE